MTRRTWIAVGAGVVVAAAVLGAAFYLGKQAPPKAARLLPESDAIFYLNLAPLRTAMSFSSHPVKHDAEYQAFIDATGIEFERDLDEAAFAVLRLPDASGPNGPTAFSEVFTGHFDGQKLGHYLAGQASGTETYAGHAVYSITHDGRTVRVAVLDERTVAVSNTPTAEQMHAILDHTHTAGLPFSGSTLLREHYRDVPLFSQAWGIGRLGLLAGDDNGLALFGLKLPIPADAPLVASLRFLGELRLRIEEIAPGEDAAAATADSLNGILQLARGMMLGGMATATTPGGDPTQELAAMLKSAAIEHHGNRVALTATIPIGLLQKLAVPEAKSVPGQNAAPLNQPSVKPQGK